MWNSAATAADRSVTRAEQTCELYNVAPRNVTLGT